MILKARHHFLIYPFFQKYSFWKIKKHFHKVTVTGHFHERKLPLLLVSNHISWWDGFWAMYLNRKIFRRKFHFMMLEEQLRKYRLFNYSGGFSVNKSSRSMVESLRYAAELLSHRENMLLLFPQGKIQSMHHTDLMFKKGVERILHQTGKEVQIIFLANLIDYYSQHKPTLYIYFEEYRKKNYTCSGIQNSYNQFYRKSVQNHLNMQE